MRVAFKKTTLESAVELIAAAQQSGNEVDALYVTREEMDRLCQQVGPSRGDPLGQRSHGKWPDIFVLDVPVRTEPGE